MRRTMMQGGEAMDLTSPRRFLVDILQAAQKPHPLCHALSFLIFHLGEFHLACSPEAILRLRRLNVDSDTAFLSYVGNWLNVT